MLHCSESSMKSLHFKPGQIIFNSYGGFLLDTSSGTSCTFCSRSRMNANVTKMVNGWVIMNSTLISWLHRTALKKMHRVWKTSFLDPKLPNDNQIGQVSQPASQSVSNIQNQQWNVFINEHSQAVLNIVNEIVLSISTSCSASVLSVRSYDHGARRSSSASLHRHEPSINESTNKHYCTKPTFMLLLSSRSRQRRHMILCTHASLNLPPRDGR